MQTQDFQIDVLNDCYDIRGRQHNDFIYERQDNDRDEMDFMYKSAPNMNGLRMGCMYGDEANDFVMNSCESIGDYGCFLYDQPQDISYEESDDDDDNRPFQEGDIFDRMEDLNMDNVNGSMLDESQSDCEEIMANDLDRAFNFNLNTMKYKHTGWQSFTDRVPCPLMGMDSHSGSQQKHKLRFMVDNNAQQIHQSLIGSVAFDPKGSIVRGNHYRPQNKKKFQPFKEFLKQSNILCEILPSNQLNGSLILSKSMLLDTNDMKKSIFFDKNVKLSEHRQILLKKIDKLMFSKNNKKFQQKIGEAGLENKVRKELKMRKFGVEEKDKENPKITGFEKSSKIAEQIFPKNGQSIHRDLKVFKRSKNLKQNVEMKGSMTEKKKQHIGSLQINKKPLGIQKKNEGKSTLRNDQNQSCQVKQIQTQKGFIYEELSPFQINTLRNTLSAKTFEVFVGLDKVYKESINLLGQLENPASESQTFILSSLQQDIDLKSSVLEQQSKQINEHIRNLQNKRLSLKRLLDSEQNCNYVLQQSAKMISPEQKDPKKQNNAGIPLIYKKIIHKRQQMRSQFDLWKEIGL